MTVMGAEAVDNVAGQSVFTSMNHAELLQTRTRLLAPEGGTRPGVWILERGDERAVIKDYHICSGRFKRFIAPIMVRREVTALRMLDGLSGIPQLLQQVDKLCFVMEYCEASGLDRDHPEDWPNPDWAQLAAVVQAMHGRGLAHCDMRRSSNILFDAQGQPYLVDFAAHVKRGRAWNPISAWIFRKFTEADRSAIAKLKNRVDPDALSEYERGLLDTSSWLEVLARALGEFFRRLGQIMTGTGGKAKGDS